MRRVGNTCGGGVSERRRRRRQPCSRFRPHRVVERARARAQLSLGWSGGAAGTVKKARVPVSRT